MSTNGTWWFGRFGYTPAGVTQSSFQMLPAPDSGITVSRTGYVDAVQFENGGQAVARSSASSRNFDMTWAVADSATQGGLDVYQDFAEGYYGTAPVYVSDPMNWRTNLFPPNWGTPGLTGWQSISVYAPTLSATAANSYNLPANSATYTLGTTPNTVPTGGSNSVYLPIPSNQQLVIGASGSSTGAAFVQVQPVTTAGAFGTVQNLTLLSPTAAVRMNTVFSGVTYSGVIVWLGRSSAPGTASTITLASMMAQIWPIGYAGAYTSLHIPGRGQSGMEFTTDAIPETYTLVDNAGGRSLKGLALSMSEVTPWRTTTS